MAELKAAPTRPLGLDFIAPPLLPAGKDENYLRNSQSTAPPGGWRRLRADEIEALVKNANDCDNWNNVLVTDEFDPRHIRNCEFYGLVRIGRLEDMSIEHHELSVPVGITNSRIIACDIGNDVAIHHVRYLAHYIVRDNVVLLNLDEMHTTNHAKFGNGIVKDGEDESVRVWMDLINEAGGRSVMPFEGMIAADAYLWAKYREDNDLVDQLGRITQRQFDSRRGFYGEVGPGCVIKNSRTIKDVKVGPCAYIKGANKLKNLTICSTAEESTQIGEGVEMVNGIVGRGCRVFYGCKAVRFVMGNNASLKYGARLIHSYLGDNSTVSCCEMLNNLIFPAHEQHHNNSFLIASVVMGQSNVAACATIGSNHNSRAPDGEIQAGRGFWPGLCVSVKHNCRFASFMLLAKGDYPAELDIPLPFSLVSNDVSGDCLQILPAYWWQYNMYALARNSWKFQARDKRKTKVQNIEFDYLAPDTAEEMLAAMRLLEIWTAKAHLRQQDRSVGARSDAQLARLGRKLLIEGGQETDALEVCAENVEHSSRKAIVLKARQAYGSYRDMLHYYAVKNLFDYMQANPKATLASTAKVLAGPRRKRWVNLGGQLVEWSDLTKLKGQITSGRLGDWPAVHAAYDRLWAKYPQDKQRHAYATLLALLGVKKLTRPLWAEACAQAERTQKYIADQTYLTRKKDFANPFRAITYETPEEMSAVLGSAEDNSFVKQIRGETRSFTRLARSLAQRR